MSLILIHGYLESPDMWDFAFRHESGPQIRITLPGHGLGSLRAVPDLSLMACEVWETIDKAGYQKVKFVGHSMGGYLALACAGMRPDRVEQLCLFHSTARADTVDKQVFRDKAISLISRDKETYLRSTVQGLYSDIALSASAINAQMVRARAIKSEHLIACLTAMRNRPSSCELALRRTFLIHYVLGEKDQLLPLEAMLEEAKSLETDGYSLLPECGHMSHRERPDAAAGALSKLNYCAQTR